MEPTVAELIEALRAETARRQQLEQLLQQIAGSRALLPVRWLHQLTKRGPDLRAASAAGASRGPVLDITTDAATLVADDFHRLYYDSGVTTWQDTWWLGHRALKLPFDLWLYQELIVASDVEVVIETGTYDGGSALFFASIFDLLGRGEVLTIDVDEHPGRPAHPRITYMNASSISDEAVAAATARAAGHRTMVVLDSDHSQQHVAAELRALADLVTPGCHLVVEDTNVRGKPVRPEHPPGPAEALAEWLPTRPDFALDPRGAKFLITFNPGGVLIRR